MAERLKKLEAAGGPVVLRLVEHMVQRDPGKRKTVKVGLESGLSRIDLAGQSDQQLGSAFSPSDDPRVLQ